MSELHSKFPQAHPEVKRKIDVIPVIPDTVESLLTTIRITLGLYGVSESDTLQGEDGPQRLRTHFISRDCKMRYEIFSTPPSMSKDGIIATVTVQEIEGDPPITRYDILEGNPELKEEPLSIRKKIVPPHGNVERDPEFPYSEEGKYIERLNNAYPDEGKAEKFREKNGDVTKEQMGRAGEISEGEIQDIVDEISSAEIAFT